jgi:hypothetical protein
MNCASAACERFVEVVGDVVGQQALFGEARVHAAGDDDDRDVGLRRVLADVARELQTVHVGQFERRGDEVDDAGFELGFGFGAGLARKNLRRGQPALEDLLDQLPRDLGAVDHHDARLVGSQMTRENG